MGKKEEQEKQKERRHGKKDVTYYQAIYPELMHLPSKRARKLQAEALYWNCRDGSARQLVKDIDGNLTYLKPGQVWTRG